MSDLEAVVAVSEAILSSAERKMVAAGCVASLGREQSCCRCSQSFEYNSDGALVRTVRCCRCGEERSTFVVFTAEVTL